MSISYPSGSRARNISNANPFGKGIDGEKSGLWYEGWRLIRNVGPRFIILENSPNITNRGLRTILWQIANEGYNAEWDVISCERFGMPHIRKRIFVVAYSKEERLHTQQIFKRSHSEKYKPEEVQANGEMEVRFRPGRIHDTAFWKKRLSEFHRMDHGIPKNIYNGLLAAAGDTVSPAITSWIFSRIKEVTI